MSDLFHDEVPIGFIADVWAVMQRVPRHTFQILTKRPERMAELTRTLPVLENVWLGTSVENADYLPRLDALRVTMAAIRFVSFEPLLGSVKTADLTGIQWAIVGGESGPRAREMKTDWVREIRELCRRDGTAFFFKQWGGKNKKRTGRSFDGRTWDEFPATSAGGYATHLAAPA
jgi:protein gp37